jgi:BolA protein
MQANSVEFIRQQLTEKLSPTQLEIIDDSAAHVGHVGAKGGGHYTVSIAAPLFEGKSRVECHRLVYQSLGNVVGNEIHALSIRVVRD